MKVTHFQRRPFAGQVSIERVFADLRGAMPADIRCAVHVSPYFSRGLTARFANVRDARQHQGQVNHITGDVHYLAGALDPDRTVLTIHDCVSLERLRGIKNAVLRLLWYSLPVRRCRVVTTISESTKRELLRHIRCDPEKIRVIHNCVGPAFRPCAKAFEATTPRILQIGTGLNKNLLRIAHAMRGLSCHLHIIGILSAKQKECLVNNRIDFSNTPVPTDAQVLEEFRRCDLLVFASTYEGFGLPIIEANAVGRPVITSNLFSMPEVAGQAACLVDPMDFASIRHGVERVINERCYREQLVDAGFENVKRFAAPAIAQCYAAIYREIADDAS